MHSTLTHQLPPPGTPPVMQAPTKPATTLNREIDRTLRSAGTFDANAVEKIAPTVNDLSCLSTEWNMEWDRETGYHYILRDIARIYKTTTSLNKRLCAERSFYLALYSERPDDTMHIYPASHVEFSDNWRWPAIACVAGGTLYGCSGLESHGPSLIINFIQSMDKIRAADQRAALGNTWHEIFMERTIEAFASLHAVGISLLLRTGKNHSKELMLPRMVRDRYFNKQPEWNNYHALNFNRQRVRAIVARSY